MDHGVTYWLTGLSGAGKTTLAEGFKQTLSATHTIVILDGDTLRSGLCSDLGFEYSDRAENIRRMAEVARILNGQGVNVVCTAISPQQAMRDHARSIIGSALFYEVFVSTSIEACEKRDPKGLYARARRGELKNFTGIHQGYEMPTDPALVIDTSSTPLDKALHTITQHFLTHRKAGFS